MKIFQYFRKNIEFTTMVIVLLIAIVTLIIVRFIIIPPNTPIVENDNVQELSNGQIQFELLTSERLQEIIQDDDLRERSIISGRNLRQIRQEELESFDINQYINDYENLQGDRGGVYGDPE